MVHTPKPAWKSAWRSVESTASAFALVVGSLAALAVSAPARAQDAEAQLKDLIPDAAVADPESWAAQGATPAAPATPDAAQGQLAPPEPTLDPSAPLADLPGITVPWPDGHAPLPVLVATPPEPDAQADLATVAEASPLAAAVAPEAGEEVWVSRHMVLVLPRSFAGFPERDALFDWFRKLSTLEQLDSDKDSIAQVAARARVDKDLLERLLRIYGFYQASVAQALAGANLALNPAPGKVDVRFDIIPGPRFRFGAIDLGNLALTGPDAAMLRAAVPIQSGEPLDNDRIVAARDSLDIALGENGYAFAKVGAPDLVVDHARQEGDLTIATEPGGKFRFRAVVSQNPGFLSSRHLADIARFDPGDLYRRSEQEDLKRAILATGLVSAVTVTPRAAVPPAAPGQSGEVALDVALTPGPLRTIAGLVGYESGDGLRAEASWEHRNFFPPEGMLRLRGIAGTREQLVGTTVRWNNWHGRDQVLTLDLYGNTVNRDAYGARTVAFTATFEKLTTLFFQKPWSWSVGLQALASGERESTVAGQSVPRNTYYIVALPLRGQFDRSDSLLDPTRGWRAALAVSPELSKQLKGAQTRYVRAQFDLSGYVPARKGVVLAARARVGTMPGAPLADIAPSRRFYAGGGGSVRGYGYQEIGPRNAVGDPSGGRSLVEFSAEARIDTGLFGDALQIVPFLDAGTVSESITPTLKDIQYGAGLGLRYKTGFGPLRLDIGTPLNRRPGDSPVTVSVALGQAF